MWRARPVLLLLLILALVVLVLEAGQEAASCDGSAKSCAGSPAIEKRDALTSSPGLILLQRHRPGGWLTKLIPEAFLEQLEGEGSDPQKAFDDSSWEDAPVRDSNGGNDDDSQTTSPPKNAPVQRHDSDGDSHKDGEESKGEEKDKDASGDESKENKEEKPHHKGPDNSVPSTSLVPTTTEMGPTATSDSNESESGNGSRSELAATTTASPGLGNATPANDTDTDSNGSDANSSVSNTSEPENPTSSDVSSNESESSSSNDSLQRHSNDTENSSNIDSSNSSSNESLELDSNDSEKNSNSSSDSPSGDSNGTENSSNSSSSSSSSDSPGDVDVRNDTENSSNTSDQPDPGVQENSTDADGKGSGVEANDSLNSTQDGNATEDANGTLDIANDSTIAYSNTTTQNSTDEGDSVADSDGGRNNSEVDNASSISTSNESGSDIDIDDKEQVNSSNNNDTTNNNITTTTNTTTTTTNKNNNNKLAEHGSPSESDAKPGPSVAELVRDRDRGLRWLLKARRPIRAGAEVTISYLDDTMLLDHCLVRRNELSRRDFWCRCERCVDGIDLSRSMRCSRCQEGVIYARRPSSLEGGSLAGDLARQVSSQPIPLNVSLLRPLRPAIYDEVCAADLDNWLTIGTPLLARNSGKLYYEVVLGSGCAEPQIGWASTRFQEHTDWIGSGIGDDDESWGADGARGLFWHGATQEEVAMEFPKGDWQEGDVIGCALDFEQGVLSFSENGVWSLATKWTFRAEGRWLYPAISLQGNFQMLLHSEALRYGPPSEDFGPWIEEEDVCARGPLDRRGPLRFAYVGCCCDKCGMEVDAAESSRLTDLEQEFWKLADPRAVPSADPKQVLMEDVVNRLRQLADSHFAWHSLVHRARERLLVFYGSRRDYDSQVQVWEEARDFAHHVYPAACGAHAWGQSGICGVVLKEGAAKLFELKTFFDKNPGWNEQPPKWLEELDQKKDIQRQLEHLDSRTRWAIDEAKAAYNTLVLMFGETHTWATEVQDQLLEAESFLMDVKARLDALQQ
mmetsp:Transcript_21195/g.45978  ORF Transcript_21195/g.45978 Transcript_21195/m.45978 type:complete len:1024 (+) Transcript_21195:146-3217(+)